MFKRFVTQGPEGPVLTEMKMEKGIVLPAGVKPKETFTVQLWYGIDFDGTLVTYLGDRDITKVGEPVGLMVDRVRMWLAEGKAVKIFTARVNDECYCLADIFISEKIINEFCLKHFGVILPITCRKDKWMVELWDDRAVRVITNTGYRDNGQNQS